MILISKEQGNFIKGIAIVLMLFHHLFAYSERYPTNMEIIFLSNSVFYERILGEIGKYCVPIFLFISGYGFAKSSNIKTPPRYYLNKILLLFVGYWLVFIIFIPFSYFFSEWKFVYLDARSFISNFLALSSSYNGEWWFFLPYVMLILLTPIFHRLIDNPISIIGVSLVLFGMSGIPSEVQNFLYWQPSYVLGFMISYHSEDVYKYIKKRKIALIFISILIIWFGMVIYGWNSMPFLVPFFIYLISILFKLSPKALRVLLGAVREKSLFIWLTHSFYCYHFAKNFIYYPKYTLLIFINLLMVSYLTASFLNVLYLKLTEKLKSKYLFLKEK